MINLDENLINIKDGENTDILHKFQNFTNDLSINNNKIDQTCFKIDLQSKKKEFNLDIKTDQLQDGQNFQKLTNNFKSDLTRNEEFTQKKLKKSKKIKKNSNGKSDEHKKNTQEVKQNNFFNKTLGNHQNLDSFYMKKKNSTCNLDIEVTKNLSPIIRQPKLKINDKTIKKLRSETDDLVFEDLIDINNLKQNEKNSQCDLKEQKDNSLKRDKDKFKLIICPICNTRKKYKDPRKRFGIVCCASCYGFFRNFIRKPKQYFCLAIGDCQLQSEELDGDFEKCKACWLKNCLQKFTLEQKVHDNLTEKYSPRLQSSPNVMLITLDTNSNSSLSDIKSSNLFTSKIKTNLTNNTLLIPVFNENCSKSYSNIFKNSTFNNNEFNSYSALGYKGPRVKRVCRSINDVYRGLPRAVFPSRNTFSTNNPSNSYFSSSNTFDDKKYKNNDEATTSKKINLNLSKEDNSDYSYDSDDLPITEYIARNIQKEMLESKNVSV